MATKSNGDGDDWDENAHRKASKIKMHDDRFKPTEFTHEQWIELRNWLFETGRPYRFKDDKDHRKRLYRFAMKMNQMQERYRDTLMVVALGGRIGVEASCSFLQDGKGAFANAPGKPHSSCLSKIFDVKHWYSTDPLIRGISKTTPRDEKKDTGDKKCVLVRLLSFGNRATHDDLPDITAPEKPIIVNLMYRLGSVLREMARKRGYGPNDTAGMLKKLEDLKSQKSKCLAESKWDKARELQRQITEWKKRLGANDSIHEELWKACQYKLGGADLAKVRNLIRRGAKASLYRSGDDGTTALHRAAWEGYSDALAEIVKTVSSKDEFGLTCKAGKTALHWAAMYGKVECVKILLKYMSPKDILAKAKTKSQSTALKYARMSAAASPSHKAVMDAFAAAGYKP